MEAIKKDDAKALNQLQMSREGKALARMAGEAGSYLYLPEGGTTGKGIGLYIFRRILRTFTYKYQESC